jgi:hypothetical protein
MGWSFGPSPPKEVLLILMSIFWTELSKLKMPILFLRVPGIVLLKGEFGPKQPRELERRWTGTGRKLFISLSHSFFLP